MTTTQTGGAPRTSSWKDARPRVLFLAGAAPLDVDRHVHGVFQRMRLFAQGITQTGLGLHFLFFAGVDPAEARAAARSLEAGLRRRWGVEATVELAPGSRRRRGPVMDFWRYYAAPIASAYGSLEYEDALHPAALEALVARIAQRPTAIFAQGLGPMLALARLGVADVPVYYDVNDVEDVKLARTLRTLWTRKGTVARYLQLPALATVQARAVARARKTFTCSDHDRAILLRRTRGAGRVVTIPNAADLPEPAPARTAGLTGLFVGFLGYGPNRAAADLLSTAIWPRVRDRMPDARLVIVGDRADAVAAARAPSPGVTFAGFVPDIARSYADADLFCCPIRAGGGSRTKLIEAALHGKPIVSTALGAEGLGFVDGAHALIRDGVASFAQACCDLLADPERAATLGRGARAFAAERYERSRVLDMIAREFRPGCGCERSRAASFLER